jgi:hypothetical protein
VTGTHEGDLHRGNIVVKDRAAAEHMDLVPGSNITSLDDRFDTSKYLSPHSDTVALLVLDHVVRMQNLITQANYETRLSIAQHGLVDKETGRVPRGVQERMERAGEALLSYMLFRDEAPLNGRVVGTSTFTKDFPKKGPRDKKGRSLREFDLEKRVFKYPCSYMIYSASFDALPVEMRDYLWRRLEQVLQGEDESATYRDMSEEDRQSVMEILRDTKPDFRRWLAKNRKR